MMNPRNIEALGNQGRSPASVTSPEEPWREKQGQTSEESGAVILTEKIAALSTGMSVLESVDLERWVVQGDALVDGTQIVITPSEEFQLGAA